jgi:hypothetical protein
MDLVDADKTYEGQKKIIKEGGVKSTNKKSTPSFFKTKSPMKKNYFK